MDALGNARMVNITDKTPTARRAVAVGELSCPAEIIGSIMDGSLPKGDALGVARIAGIMAAKKTSDLIPLCHSIPLTGVTIEITPDLNENRITVQAEVLTVSRTGAEMEALAAVSITLLTLYDMAKSATRNMHIRNIRLVSKEGGKSGKIVVSQADSC